MFFLDKWLADFPGHANTVERGRKAAVLRPERGIMILGTDTDVGKTHVAQILIRQLVERGHRVGAYKPVASGFAVGAAQSDPVRLREATGEDWPLELVCPQSFAAALAPPIAARREGRCVDEPLLSRGAERWCDRCDVLVVEGAGGALSPLGPKTTVLDVADQLRYPVVLVASHRLGMMNHVLLTLEAVRSRQLEILALIVNEPQCTDPGAEVRRDESLACLLPFCGKIACYGLEYDGSTLFPLG